MARFTTALEVLGLAAVAYGVSLWSLAAGIVAAGLALVLVGYLIGNPDGKARK
jgi:hypothetical protein